MRIEMKRMRRLILLLTIIFSTLVASAQSTADKLYNEGLKFQQTMTVQAQNNAIAKFRKAKIAYDSADKKAKCDAAIKVSQGILSQLKSGGGGGKPSKPSNTDNNQGSRPVVTPTLELSCKQFEVSSEYTVLSVTVTTNQNSWDTNTSASGSGTRFLTVKKTGANTFEIIVPANMSNSFRTETVTVSAGNLAEAVYVKQEGAPVTLFADPTSLEFKAKGGDKKLDLYCDADLRYPENANNNWYIINKPAWITISTEVEKSGGLLQNVKKKANELKDKAGKLFTGSSSSGGEFESTSKLKIKADKNGFPAARKGKIVIMSGETILNIEVSQAAN